jgi:hypothetical protein
MIENEGFFFSWQYYIVLMPGALLVLWVADIYYRYVDLPNVLTKTINRCHIDVASSNRLVRNQELIVKGQMRP